MAEIIRLEVGNVEAFKKAFAAAGDNIEEQAKVLARFQKQTGKGIPVELEYTVKNRGKAEVRDIRVGIRQLTEEERKFRNELAKRTSTESKSLTATRQRLAQAKQVLNSLNQNTEAYARQQRRVERLNTVLQRRQGIQAGSVTALKGERNALLEFANNTTLGAAARDDFNKKLLASNESLRRAQGIEKGSIDDLKARRGELQQLSNQYAIGSRRQQQFAGEISLINRQLAQTVPTFQRLITSLNQIATIQAGFTAISAFAGQINGLINQFTGRIKQIENFSLAIENVGFSLGQTSAFFEEATQTAFRLGAPITQVEQAYKRMIPALQGAGVSSDESTRFIENLAARTQTLGLSSEQSGRLVEAFAQVLSKGKLQAEELNQQISEVDGAFRTQFAEAIGITVEQLSEFVKQGDVTATRFVTGFNAMQNGVDVLAAKVRTGNLTIQQLQNTIANVNTKALEAIGTAIEPAIRAILRITLAIQQFAVQVANSQFGQLIAKAFNESIAGIEAFLKTLVVVIGVIGELLKPLVNLLTLLQQNIFGLGSFTRALVYLGGVLLTVRLGLAALTKSLSLTAALVGGRFVSSWGAAGAALLGFASIAKSLLTLNFVGFGTKIQGTFDLIAKSFVSSNVAGSKLQGTFAALSRAARSSGGSFTVFAERFTRLQGAIGKAGAGSKVTSSNWRELGKSANVANAATSGLAYALTEAGVELGLDALIKGKNAKITGDVAKASAKASRGVGALGKVFSSLGPAIAKAGGIAKIAGSFLKLTIVSTLVSGGIQAIVNTFNAYGKANDVVGSKTEELNSRLKEQGFIVKETTGFWQELGKGLKFVFVDLGGLIPLLNGIAINNAFEGQIKNVENNLKQVNKTLIESGFSFDSTGAKITFFADKARVAAGAIDATKDSLEAQVGALDEYIRKLQVERGENDGAVKSLKEKRDRLAEQAALYALLARRVDASNQSVEEAARADDDFLAKLQETSKWLERRKKLREEEVSKISLKNQKDYIKGLITEGELRRRNAQEEVISTQASLSRNIANLKNLKKEGKQKLSNIQKNELEKKIEKSLNTILSDKNKLAEQLIALKDANLKQLDEEIQKVNDIAGIYDTVRDQSANIASQIGGTITGAIDAIKSGITQAAALEFSVNFDESAFRRAANVRQRLGALEFKLERIKIQTEKIIQVSTLRRVADERRLLAAKLRSEGDTAGAVLQEQAAAAIERQIPALSAAFDLQSRIAGLQERGYKAEVNRKRELLGLPALFANTVGPTVKEWEDTVASGVRNVTDEFEQSSAVAQAAAQNGAEYYTQATRVIAASADERARKQQEINDLIIQALDEQVGSLQEILAKLNNTTLNPQVNTEGLEKAGDGAEQVYQAFKDVNDFISGLQWRNLFADFGQAIEIFTAPDPWNQFISKVKEAASALDNLFKPRKSPSLNLNQGAPARWMGGPVDSGQTYTVNDGGGREGFLDKFNNFKMLPAGRNIQWTPTTSGTVVPAHLVDQFKQSMMSGKVNSVSTGPRQNGSANRINASLDSGNLVKQIGSAMAGSGGTQRITNNVTIQSQAPVMDASRLMANVSRLRNRRRSVL